jgi:gamma-glutamylcysteine synthetase
MSTILNSAAKERLYNRFIATTEKNTDVYAGIEVELPIVNLRREAVNFIVVHDLTRAFAGRFDFTVDKFDDDGNPLALDDKNTGDIFTFDCSYNTLEISLGIVDNLHDADTRLLQYLNFIQYFLQKHDHIAVGLGTNPHRQYNNHVPIQNGRYQMLFHHLSSYKKFLGHKKFFPYPAFGMFTAASQIQLDILPGKFIQTLKLFNALEPFKSALFANSPLKPEGLLLSRDRLWAESMQGYNPRNIGAYDPVPDTVDELLEYMLDSSIYCAERDGKYFNFTPVPLREYFTIPKLTAEYFSDGKYHTATFVPALEDLEYFRTFKFQDPTFRGTVEFRSVCSQPLRERLTAAAFHLGLIHRLDELEELLKKDTEVHKKDLSAVKLRNLLNREIWPDNIDRAALRKTLLSILAIAGDGLRARNKNEELFLAPLFDRADQLISPAREYIGRLSAGEKTEKLILDYADLN